MRNGFKTMVLAPSLPSLRWGRFRPRAARAGHWTPMDGVPWPCPIPLAIPGWLLHVTKWDLSAALKPSRDLAWVDPKDDEWSFQLTSEDGYVSHYKPPEEHDSALESGFAERFARLDTPWRLEREVDLVPVPGGVILPDFRLVHPDERSVLVEIVGYWRPEYLRKKFALLKKSGRTDLIVCVSERLNLDRAGVDPSEFGDRLVWFKGVLNPKDVLTVAERTAVPT